MVWLDFGLSRILGEELGQKTLTGFVGTFEVTSKEMQKLYFLKNRSLVDLYHNDVCGLNYTC